MSTDTTQLIAAVRAGRPRSTDELFERVYGELRRLSQSRVAAEPGVITLTATGLVHEAYLKMLGETTWEDRATFFGVASSAMRQILIDRARARRALKRGGGARPETLSDDLAGEADAADQVLSVDAALGRLARHDPELVKVVELRFFAGLEVSEVADVLGVSARTAARHWARAKAHLRAELS